MMAKPIEWSARAHKPVRPACTLLIPERLAPYLRKRKRKHGGVLRYLQHLLLQAPAYRAAGLIPNVQRTTRYYQRPRQQLQRWHVRIPAHHWTELRCLAGGSGVTMAHMFVLLMKAERSGALEQLRRYWGASAVPTLIWKKIGFWEARVEPDLETRRYTQLFVQRAPP